ncbi:hypothetical protein IFM60648_01023 [Aspergillus lentulus]|nr:hypothetical protein IFM60648_01023 [Aspergillus lentulus]
MYLNIILCFSLVTAALQTLPPVYQTALGPLPGFDVCSVERVIYIKADFASHRDENGLTLIPPSALEFATTFLHDLEEVTASRWTLRQVHAFRAKEGIFLDSLGADCNLTYENGTPTEEGYEVEIQPQRAIIRGSGARGMWWGTRTLLQKLIIADRKPLPGGRIVDAPSVPTRGYMLDAGRK